MVKALADAIELVRTQLEKAIKQGEESSVAFQAGPVELDFEVVFSATGGGEAGMRVWVVSVGAKCPRALGRLAVRRPLQATRAALLVALHRPSDDVAFT